MLQISHDWLQILDEENVQCIILDSQTDSELIEVLRSQPRWSVDFEDTEVAIFTLAKSDNVC